MKQFLLHHKLQTGLLTLFCSMLMLFMVTSPGTFLSGRIYISFMSVIPFTAFLALGLTFLIISGEMDLSFPSVMAISGLAFSSLYTSTGDSLIALIGALSSGALAGYLNGLIVVKIGVPAIIATIGTQFLWRGASTLLAGGLAKNISGIRESALHRTMVGRLNDTFPVQSLWCVAFAILLWLLLNRHTWGDNIRFIGDDMKTAKMMGVNTDRNRISLFVMMGLISAMVSVMICLEMANWWPTQGEGYLLLVFASVFIGGTSVFGGEGTIFGTMIGAIIIGMIEAGIISAGLSGFWTRLVYGLIIVLSVSLYAIIFKTKRDG